MAEEGFKRKLTDFLNGTVNGYSRLMMDDEGATVRNFYSSSSVEKSSIQMLRL